MLMAVATNKYLQFIRFADLCNWSVQYLGDTKIRFNKRYSMARIGDFLTRNKTAIVIEDDVYYKRATIKIRNGGVFLRDSEIGSKIGTKNQFVISKGQFLLSKIDARNGAFGVVPEVLDGGIITGNFWTFDVDYSKVNPYYLTLLSTTKEFVAFCEQASNGTTNRHYLQEPLFLDIKVPLPSLPEQNKLVEEYNTLKRSINMEEIRIAEAYSSMQQNVLKELGIEPAPKSRSLERLQFLQFKNLHAWSVELILHANNSPFGQSQYNCKVLSQLAFINPKTDLSNLKDRDEMSFIPMADISNLYGEWVNHKVGHKSDSKGYTKFQDRDIIWARITPCMQNGKSTIVHNMKNGVGYGSTEFHVIRIKSEEVLPQYIHTLLRHDSVLFDAVKYFTGSAGQQRVPASYLANLIIPIPPLSIQVQIADHYHSAIENSKHTNARIFKYKDDIIKDFEAQIFEY